MGGIIYWAIIRIAILLPLLWIATDYIEFNYWWMVVSMSIYGFILHPAFIQYKMFREKNEEVITNSLCSSCKHFDETAVLCLKFDEHPTEDEIPCEGSAWEPKLD
jgi:fatty acid desaturase